MIMKRTLAAFAIVVGTATAAAAADIPMVPAPPPPPPPAPSFDWSGPYIGALAGWTLGPGLNVAGQIGYNFDMGGFVAGVEARVGAAVFIPAAYGSVGARAGVALGATDNILLYGAAAVGFVPAGPAFFYTFGGGVEFAAGASTSLFLEARGIGVFGGGCCGLVVQGGVNWHF